MSKSEKITGSQEKSGGFFHRLFAPEGQATQSS